MKCDKHPEVEMVVMFKGGFGAERKFRCLECEKEERAKGNGCGQNVFSSSASWGSK